MDESQLQDLVETVATETIRKFHPTYWLEDHISVDLVYNITKQLQGLRYSSASGSSQIELQAYKARGAKVEHIHGDIAVLVSLAWADGSKLEGAGFYEAKKRDAEKDTYSALDYKQLATYLSKTPHLSTLLYDYDLIKSFVHWPYGGSWCSLCAMFHTLECGSPQTHMLSIPADIVVARKNNSTLLYKHGIPFSYQFVVRHLNGFDLERDSTIIQRVKGYGEEIVAPKIILVASKGIEVEPPPLPEVNHDIYEPLSDGDLPRRE